MDTTDVQQLVGRTAHGNDGQKLGKIQDIYLDQDTGKPEWMAITTGLFGSNVSFVPLAEASVSGDDVQVPYTKDQVKDAPNADPDGQLSQEEEQRLYSHYGLSYGESRSDSGLPQGGGVGGTAQTGVGRTGAPDQGDSSSDPTPEGSPGVVGNDVSGPETDQAMTRSEEELRVGKRSEEIGRARLRKYIVTEDVQTTVPVQREQVRVEREPITDANIDQATSGPDLSEEEHEVTLHAETPVVEKDVVPKERVRLDTDTVQEERRVDETVRKEQIEADGER
jgi:uncharacterized protein (TIGR02271 family)